MDTKYGNISDQIVVNSLNRLVGKVYKILPMREENCETLDEYVDNLLRELINQEDLIKNIEFEEDLLSLISTLSGVGDENLEFSKFRSDVLKSLNIIKKMIKKLEEGN